MKKILFLQNNIMHYRKDVYNSLAINYEVTVLHSGEISKDSNDLYLEIITPVYNIGPFYLQPNIINEVSSDSYDIIISMFDLRWVNNILSILFKNKKRFILWGHRYSKNIITNYLRDKIMNFSDAILLYDECERSRMIIRGVNEKKIYIANNTLHVTNHGKDNLLEKNCFVYVGRAQKRKKIDIFFKAFKEVINLIPDFIKIEIVGDGEENYHLIKLAKSLGIYERVVFHGEVIDQEKLREIYNRAFAYVSPGPVGLGVLHSLAYGVPVITSTFGKHGPEFQNLEHMKNSLLFSTHNEFKSYLVSSCNDFKLRKTLSENAYNHYSCNRTLDVMIKGFIRAIEEKNIAIF